MKGHYKSSADDGRHSFGGHNGDGGDLDAHAETHEHTADEQLPPCLGESLSEDRKYDKKTGEEDDTATTEVVVQRVGKGGAEKAEDGGGGIEEADEPFIVYDPEFSGEGKVGAICSGVIPSSVVMLDAGWKKTMGWLTEQLHRESRRQLYSRDV